MTTFLDGLFNSILSVFLMLAGSYNPGAPQLLMEAPVPFAEVRNLYMPARGPGWAAVGSEAGRVYVSVGARKFGPYDRVDVEKHSPFRKHGRNWSFRGIVGEETYLIVNGRSFGPYSRAWSAEFDARGKRWGALVKQGSKYHTLVDGKLSPGYDFIFPDANLLPLEEWGFYGKSPYFPGVPHLFGKKQSLAFAVNAKGAYHILRENGVSGPFTAMGGVNYRLDDSGNPVGKVNYSDFFSPDEKHVAVALRKGEEDHTYLSVDGILHGPYEDARYEKDYFIAKRNMSIEGENWVLAGTEGVFTRDGKIPANSPDQPKISADGLTISYIYTEGNDRYLVVNEQTFGPYRIIGNLLFLEEGPDWLCTVIEDNGEAYILSSDGEKLGPYTFLLYWRLAQGWFSMFNQGDGLNIGVDGETIAGPFESIATHIGGIESQILPHNWSMTARKGEDYSVYINGKLEGTFGPYDVMPPPTITFNEAGDAWNLTLQRGATRHFIVNGTSEGQLTYPDSYVYQDLHFSPDFLVRLGWGYKQSGGYYLFSREGEQGPFASLAPPVFGPSGRWLLNAFNEDGKQTLLGDGGQNETFADIRAYGFANDSEAYLLSKNDAGEYRLRWKGEEYGPYAQAGVMERKHHGLTLAVQPKGEEVIRIYRLR